MIIGTITAITATEWMQGPERRVPLHYTVEVTGDVHGLNWTLTTEGLAQPIDRLPIGSWVTVGQDERGRLTLTSRDVA